jgi:hypothetical protein
MSFVTGTNVELIYTNTAAGTAKNTFTSEVQINDTAGMGVQAHLPPDFWTPTPGAVGRGIHIVARGVLSTFTSGTYTISIRAGTAGSTTSAIILGTGALTMTASQTNIIWELEGDVILTAIGAAGTNSTVRGIGQMRCPAMNTGTPASTSAPVWGGAASPGTVATFDTSITNYINFNIACSVSSASNGITLHQLLVFGLN